MKKNASRVGNTLKSLVGRPVRVRLSRRKGWRLPPNTVVVARPSRWGNPHPIGPCPHCEATHTREEAIAEFRAELFMEMNYQARDRIRRDLAGKNLACWCPLDQPCHADTLLEIANEYPPEDTTQPPTPILGGKCLLERDCYVIDLFCDEVERIAERNMLKTGKLEGAHYAAMRQLRASLHILADAGSPNAGRQP